MRSQETRFKNFEKPKEKYRKPLEDNGKTTGNQAEYKATNFDCIFYGPAAAE